MSTPIIVSLVVVAFIVMYFIRHIVGGAIGLYRVVPANEAHIRIMNNKKEVFCVRNRKSSYWAIPFITKLHRLPLCNLAIPVNDIKLNDKNMAKFVTDIMCFINISDLDLAVERLTLTDTGAKEHLGFDFQMLSEDLRAIMESIGRTVTTKQSILDIYMNRSLLDQAITKEVEVVFPKWGIELVDLELKDIKDAKDSTIIHDIERKVAAEVRRDADIAVSNSTKEAEMVKAKNEEEYKKRQIEKDEMLAIAAQNRIKKEAEAAGFANIQMVEAKRKLEVGASEIRKQQAQLDAEAKKITFTTEAEGEKNKIMSIGEAEANVIRTKKFAEAEGTLKLAEAMKEFNDVALNVKILDINKEVKIAQFKAMSDALSKADIKLILSAENASNLFGLKLDASSGANLEQFITESGLSMDKIKELIANIKK
jgi:uncharacterized membrane protein YqiK